VIDQASRYSRHRTKPRPPKGLCPSDKPTDLRSDPIRGNSKRKTTCKSVAYVASVPHDLEASKALG
jgi:hypothetical protein